MNKRELFAKLYGAHVQYEFKLDRLAAEGVNLHDSVLTDSFYMAFDVAVNTILTPEGSTVLYEEILFVEDMTLDKAIELLQEYFI